MHTKAVGWPQKGREEKSGEEKEKAEYRKKRKEKRRIHTYIHMCKRFCFKRVSVLLSTVIL